MSPFVVAAVVVVVVVVEAVSDTSAEILISREEVWPSEGISDLEDGGAVIVRNLTSTSFPSRVHRLSSPLPRGFGSDSPVTR